jgi:hypothetical protein
MSLANQSALIGVTNDAASADARFPLGTTVVMGNFPYTYASATAAIAAAGTVTLTGAFASGAGSTHTHDVPAPGVLINQYFWAKRAVSPL